MSSATRSTGSTRSIETNTERRPLYGTDREAARRIADETEGRWSDNDLTKVTVRRRINALEVTLWGDDNVIASFDTAQDAVKKYEVVDMMAYSTGNVRFLLEYDG